MCFFAWFSTIDLYILLESNTTFTTLTKLADFQWKPGLFHTWTQKMNPFTMRQLLIKKAKLKFSLCLGKTLLQFLLGIMMIKVVRKISVSYIFFSHGIGDFLMFKAYMSDPKSFIPGPIAIRTKMDLSRSIPSSTTHFFYSCFCIGLVQ